MNDDIQSMHKEIENLKREIENLEGENIDLKSDIENLEGETIDLKKKLERSKETISYYSNLSTKHQADFERVHRILDHLRPAPPRTEEKTEENKCPDTYDLVTRLAIWLGNK